MSKSKFQLRQTVNGILFQLVNGTRVLFRVFQAAMAEQTGNGLDVGTIVQDVDGKGMTGAVPADMLVDAGTLHPSPHRLTTALVSREVKDEVFLSLAGILGLTDKRQQAVAQRYRYPTACGVTLGLVLLKRQQSVGIVDAAILQVFDITEPHARIETEDESVADIFFLSWIMGVYEPLNLLLREDILVRHKEFATVNQRPCQQVSTDWQPPHQ